MDHEETGETITIIRSAGYTIHYIKPCTMEKGKKMAKIRLKHPPGDLLEKAKTRLGAEIFPDVGVAKLQREGKHIMIFSSGEIAIRAAQNAEDVVRTGEELAAALLS